MSLFVGVDVGCDKTVATVTSQLNALSAKLVRNNLEHDTTPSVVAFAQQRLVGENGRDQLRINPGNAVTDIPRLIGTSKAAYDALTGGEHAFTTVQSAKSTR